jgi:signal transduction histidine kinase/ligand-binding sensor domain-containing protein
MSAPVVVQRKYRNKQLRSTLMHLSLYLLLFKMLGRRRTLIRSGVLIALIATAGMALDPRSATRDFIRTDFTVEDGLPSNVVNAILQTRNGFLWVGTDAGLVRFNGRRFISIEFRAPPQSPQGGVRSLLEGPDGDLWVGTGAGLARIPRHALDVFDQSSIVFYHPGTGLGDEVSCLRFSPGGSLWVGTEGGLYRFTGGHFAAVVPGVVINRMEKAANGHLLILTQRGFVEWDGTRIVEDRTLASQFNVKPDQILDVFDSRSGARWFCTFAGLARRVGDRLERFPGFTPPNVQGEEHNAGRAEHAYEDQQGTMWVQFARSLYRVSAAGTFDHLVQSSVREIYSDRDGDLWAGTNGEGLLRFKDRAVRMFTKQDGLPTNVPMTVLSRRDGSLWVGTNCGGLSVYENHRFRAYAEKDGLSNSCVWSLAEDHDDNLWLGTWGGGLFRFAGNHFTQFSMREGLAGNIVRNVQVTRDGSLWIATDGGVSHLVNGKFHNFTVADGLSSIRVLAVYQDHLDRIWAGTSRGIDRLAGERFVSVRTPGQIFDPRTISFAESSSGDLYVMDAPRGIDRLEGDRFVAVNRELDLFSVVFLGQNLWFTAGNGVFRFPLSTLNQDEDKRDQTIDYTSFGKADGMNSTQCSIGSPNVALTRDKKLWVATVRGLGELDLDRLPRTMDKPGIFVSEVTVGRTQQIAGSELVLPPGTHHTELHFDAISLKSPEKVRFQYRMDGIDTLWLDANSSLTAVYTNIPTGTHIFHVRACNIQGVWDPVGISYRVTEQPQVYETTWFRASSVLAIILLLAGAYRLRLRQIADEFNLRLDERVIERTRIARDLHDTLLQSFHGLMLRFQSVQNMLPARPLEARQSLQIAIDRAEEAITEGRDAVQELRGSAQGGNDLVESLTSIGQELAAIHASAENDGGPVAFRVLVEGTPRQLQLGLGEDLQRLAREALANAFHHAGAKHIELDIRYSTRVFWLRVRDDGIGMDPKFIKHGGREGHWGLPGMRERAGAIGGRLEIWSELGRGTEVEVTLPAVIAYPYSGRGHRRSSIADREKGGVV